MKCKAGKKWGENTYKCTKCGIYKTLENNEEILEICSCGNDEFEAPIEFERSDNGYREKLDEIIRILEVSIFLCQGLEIDSFYNVIAVQLRILLCDNSRIIRSRLQKPKLHPHTGNRFKGTSDYESILSENLFDKTKMPIALDKWLKQEVAWSPHWEPMDVKDVIDAWANKNGGAHIDSRVPEKEMFAIAVSGKDYLIAIARYVIELLGYDLHSDILEHLLRPYNNLLNS
ncbi:hypothetical protein [Desulfosporosinus sp. BG]|uniref:hypothetical protein n=1 Tax=Desulfosporosinus sp. BG TaxID=1633135 RepID=UPI00083AC0A8|nr:hypothetical protein [Desulfosporosinus sp. BG]ODA41817.1 hypothetical protein DSBG_1309 [Desulfosporosinus sp. BG]